MRRLLTILLLLAILGGIAWWLVRWQRHEQVVRDPWSAVPTTAAVIISVPSPLQTWDRFTGTAQLWGAMEPMPGCHALSGLVQRIGLAAMAQEELATAIGKAPLLITLNTGHDGGTTIIWPLPASTEALAALGPAFGVELGPGSPFWEERTVVLRPDSALPALHATWRDGLLLMATSADLLEASLVRAQAPPSEDASLTQARATLGQGADAHVLVQPGRAARLLERWLSPAAFDQFTVPEGWAGLDVRLRPDVVLLSGLLFTPSPTPALKALEHQGNERSSLGRVLPARTNWMRSFTVTDPVAYWPDTVPGAPSADLFEAYASWVHGPVGQASAFTLGDPTPAQWTIVRTEDPTRAAQALSARCPEGRCDTTSYRGVRIARVADAGALEAVMGSDLRGLPQPLWAILGDKVVYTEHPAWMREVIDSWTDGNSLALDPRSGRFFQRFSSEAGITWWADGARSFAPLRTMARPATVEGMDRWFKVWQALGGCLLEVSSERPGVYQIGLSLQHAPIGQQEADALWSASIGSKPSGRPWLLKDHLSRTLLVLTQDREDRISLISCTGKVLWQRELDGPIQGEVQQVDRYRNGKLQMVLNTSGRLYQIDRNGQDVEGFPITLPQAASAPVQVFDYDGDREYRMLLPLMDGRVLNFDGNGKAVQGWEPKALTARAIAPVQHLRIAGKDYLVLVPRSGKLVLLDRRGTVRSEPTLRMNGIVRFHGMRTGSDIASCSAWWTDSTGAVLSGLPDGRVDTIAPSAGGSTLVLGLEQSGTPLVARVRHDSVTVSDAEGPRFGSFLPESHEGSLFIADIPGTGPRLGAVSPEREQVRLFQHDGTLWPGFPLKGGSPFRVADINLDGVLEMVTTTRDGNVLAYPLEGGGQ